jgi:hypothetical protein
VRQAALLIFEHQLAQPEVLSTWYNGDRRAKWRAEVASGGMSVGAGLWQEALRRMTDAGVSLKARLEIGKAWLPLCHDPAALGTMAAPAARCVSVRLPLYRAWAVCMRE